jgi:hypothetical protein
MKWPFAQPYESVPSNPKTDKHERLFSAMYWEQEDEMERLKAQGAKLSETALRMLKRKN